MHPGWVISYSDSASDLTEHHLRGGFFDGWAAPPLPEQHLRILQNSTRAVVARTDDGNVVGFVTALSDGVLSAYIPLLEVLPAHRGAGVGTTLVRRVLANLAGVYMIDVMCDADVIPFYERLGFARTTGAVIRNYDWQRPNPTDADRTDRTR
jgi:ribosomal protein S18 acetylase RimI-like enzyme